MAGYIRQRLSQTASIRRQVKIYDMAVQHRHQQLPDETPQDEA